MAKVVDVQSLVFENPFKKEINYFKTVAEYLNISKASEMLGIQQSGLSRAIARLEDEIGEKLFYRNNTGLSLTELGSMLFSALTLTKLKWAEEMRSLAQGRVEPVGKITIATHTSFGGKFMPAILEALGIFKNLNVEVQTMTSFQTVRGILGHSIDYGLVSSKAKEPELVYRKISDDYLAAYSVQTVNVPRALFYNPDMRLEDSKLKKFSKLRRVIVSDYDLIAQSLLRNSDLGIMPFSVASRYPELEQIGERLIEANISLVFHQEKLKGPANKKLSHCILDSCLT